MGKDAEIPLAQDVKKDPEGASRSLRKIAMILNSLIRRGFVKRTDKVNFEIVSGGENGVVNIANGTGLGASPSPITENGTLFLLNTAVSPGNYSFSNITVDAQGRITSASNGAEHNGTVTSVGSGTGLTGGPITTSGNLSLANTAVTAGTYTEPTLTIDAQGRITSAANGTDVGATVGNGVTTLNDITTFTFSGVAVAAGAAHEALLNISGGGGGNASITVSDGNTTVANATTLNFTGATVTGTTPTANIAITGGGNGSINGWEHPFTKPTIASVTRVNTTGFTDTDDTNGLLIARTGSLSNSDNLTLAHVAVPGSGAWNLDVRIMQFRGDEQFAVAGAHLYESGTGKIMVFGVAGNSSSSRLFTADFNSTTSFHDVSLGIACFHRYPWLRISFDGSTNLGFWISDDGYSWAKFNGLPLTWFFTTGPSHAGFFLDPYGTTFPLAVKCLSLTCN